MRYKTLFASVIAIANAANANAYAWLENQHACVVETGTFMSTDGTSSGVWGNAPKSFFVTISSCPNFAKSFGYPYEVDKDFDGPDILVKMKISECVQASGLIENFVVEVQGLSVGLAPVMGAFFTEMPVASSGGSMKFNDDGYINYSEYGELKGDDSGAWFMLRANCTVLRP